MPSAHAKGVREETKEFWRREAQSKLFLRVIIPNKPVAPSTVARWLKTVLDKAGIDTSIFKAHSTRGAAATAAANAGIITEDILKAADWSGESVFKKY